MTKHLKLILSLQDEPFFRTMGDGARERIEGYVFHREYESRQVVFFPEDPCDYVYWVREGRVKVTLVSPSQRRLTFFHFVPGDMFGEQCLVGRAKRDAYAEAMTPSILCQMRADDFLRVAREEPEVSFKIAQQLCGQVMEMEEVLSEIVFKPVRSRVAAGLLRMYNRTPEQQAEGSLRVTHEEIASLIGSTRETTTTVLHDLRQAGILGLANRRVTVLDPVALARVAGGP